MLNVEYLITTSFSFLENIAAKLSDVCGEKVHINDNERIIVPPCIGTGEIKFYTRGAGISLCVIDCVFNDDIRLIRPSLMINDFHLLSFNISGVPIIFNKANGGRISDWGDRWENSIIYSSSGKGSEWLLPKRVNIKLVVVFFTKEWILKKYCVEQVKINDFIYKSILERPQQLSLNIDFQLFLVIQKIVAFQTPMHMRTLYYEGYAVILVALIVQRLFFSPELDINPRFDEVTMILEIEKEISQALDKPLPLLEELANKCSMSKTKFAGLFKTIYGKSYYDFFRDTRMQLSAELLLKGWQIADVASAVGYNNIAHFTKLFREMYNTTPKMYQMKNTTILAQ